MFAWKESKDVNVMKPKAMLVARGLSQDVDFVETCASTPAASTVSLDVVFANENGWESRPLDVKQIFIRTDL